MAKPDPASALSRRAILGGALGTGASLLAGRTRAEAPQKSPQILVKKQYRIRVLGTHVTLQEPLRERAQRDLGIEVEFSPGGDARILHQAATRPASFDLYEQWSNSINVLWQAGAIQPIERSRIRYWNDINALTKTGRLTPGASLGRGDAPYSLLNVQSDGSLGPGETKTVSFLPYVHNVDSFGYNASQVPEGRPYETESWGWLLNEKHAGKVALANDPTIGLFDAALAARAAGLVHFGDIGSISRQELDQLFALMIRLKRAGHFRGVWSSVPQSVDFMRRDGVVLESMFSPAAAELNGQGVNCIYAAPKEGYRAWHGVMCLSAKTSGPNRDAAYEYMNWWLSGWPGAFIARQGYYISTPHLSRGHMSEDEWDYWYDGQPARSVLMNTRGEAAVQAGSLRRGGSYQERFSRVAVWNTVLPNYEYCLERWGEFLLA